MNRDLSFWQAFTEVINTNRIIIDRPKGSTHPRYPDLIYPLDYGYLENTRASDGDGIDVWFGSLNMLTSNEDMKTLTGILCTFDTLKRDAEIKVLIGCNQEDIRIIRDFHQGMHTVFIANPIAEHDLSN